MKTLHNFLPKTILVLSVIIGIISSQSCKKEDDTTPIETDSTPRYIGFYSTVEKCSNGANSNHSVNVVKATTAAQTLLLKGFGGFGVDITATVSSTNLTIPNQVVDLLGNKLSISGSGSINGKILTVTFTYSISGTVTLNDSCTSTLTKP